MTRSASDNEKSQASALVELVEHSDNVIDEIIHASIDEIDLNPDSPESDDEYIFLIYLKLEITCFFNIIYIYYFQTVDILPF